VSIAMSDDIQMTEAEELQELRAEKARLIAERDSERQRAEAESRRADGLTATSLDAQRRLNVAEVGAVAAQEQQADTTIAAIDSELSALKRDLANLNAEGKFEEAAELQEKIGDAAARRTQARQAKTYYAQQKERAAAAPVDPLDRFFAANPRYTEAEKTWIRQNPRYATDSEFMARVNQAHADAVREGVAPQSQEYFERLEAHGYMKPRKAAPAPRPQPSAMDGEIGEDGSPYSDAAQGEEEPTVQTPRPRQSVAARPSNRAPASPNGRQGTRLTADETETALALSYLMPDDVVAGGEAEIINAYAKLKNSPMARRRQEDWRIGG
jgi:hypothetical protein